MRMEIASNKEKDGDLYAVIDGALWTGTSDSENHRPGSCAEAFGQFGIRGR